MFGLFKKDVMPVKIGAAPEAAVAATAAADRAQVLPLRAIAETDAAVAPMAVAGAYSVPAAVPSSVAAPAGGLAPVAVQAPPALEAPIITSLSQVGKYSRILTADHGHSYRIPKDLEAAVMVLETAPKRAVIYYNPAAPTRQTGEAMINLRRELLVNDFNVDKERRCSEVVMKALLEDYRSKPEHSHGSSSSSAAKAMWEAWQDIAWRERASDIHIRIVNREALVMIRVDGTLEPLPDGNGGIYTATQAEQAMGWAYGDASATDSNNAAMFNAKDNIYSMFKPRVIDGNHVGMRFQSLAGQYGPKVVCRLLNTDTDAPTLSYDELGYEDSHQVLFKEASENPTGLVIFAGITGSGKSTSQKTYIETHPDNGSAAFYSVEDPIEYPLRNVHQIPIQRDLSDPVASEKKYNDVIAGIVRADPDGMLIGEIRDKSTAAAGQQIVETGHWAAGTVHAHLISGIIPRLTDESIGMSREVLTGPNILNLLVYQGLVPILCTECRINGTDKSEFGRIHFGKEGGLAQLRSSIAGIGVLLSTLKEKFSLEANLFNFRRNGGCQHCKGRGTKGLTVVAEMLMPDEKWLEYTREKRDHEAVAHYRSFSDGDFRSPDMTGKTVFEHALYKSTLGIVDPRRCQSFDTFKRFKILDKKNK